MSFSSLYSQITKGKQDKSKTGPPLSLSKSSFVSNSINTPKKQSNGVTKSTLTKKISLPSSSSSHINDDPSVRRLKEARRLERERLEALNPKKKTAATTKSKKAAVSSTERTNTKPALKKKSPTNPGSLQSPKPTPVPTKSRFKHNPFAKKTISPLPTSHKSASPQPPAGDAAKPTLSFKELMKQAENVKSTPTAANVFTSKKIQSKEPSKAFKSLQKTREELLKPSVKSRPREKKRIPVQTQSFINTETPIKPQKLPSFAQPNTALLNKLKQKKSMVHNQKRSSSVKVRKDNSSYTDSYGIDAGEDDEDDEFYDRGYDYDSEDDGFIVDDDEELEAENLRRYNSMQSQGYSKSEIWEIFNKGKKRRYDDYDDYDSADDMEATGTEILEDEERTLKQAKLDDLREQRLLEQKAAEKKRRFLNGR